MSCMCAVSPHSQSTSNIQYIHTTQCCTLHKPAAEQWSGRAGASPTRVTDSTPRNVAVAVACYMRRSLMLLLPLSLSIAPIPISKLFPSRPHPSDATAWAWCAEMSSEDGRPSLRPPVPRKWVELPWLELPWVEHHGWSCDGWRCHGWIAMGGAAKVDRHGWRCHGSSTRAAPPTRKPAAAVSGETPPPARRGWLGR